GHPRTVTLEKTLDTLGFIGKKEDAPVGGDPVAEIEIDLVTRQFLGDLVARPRDLVVLPLRQHIVDAVKADDCLDLGRDLGMAAAEMLAREQRLVAREGHEGGEVRARGIADQPYPFGIEAELGGLSAHELHRRLGVVYRAGPSL